MSQLFRCYLTLLLTGCLSVFAFADHVSTQLHTPAQLIKALQGGGHIIYMRHGPTVHSQKDAIVGALGSCNRQRNLSTAGRELVKDIGFKIKALNIPIGEVFSSPFCRCQDTAQLAFGVFKVIDELKFSMTKNMAESKQLGDTLHYMFEKSTITHNNQVFVGHTSNLRDGLGVWPKPEAVVVVFQKLQSKLIYKGMIKPDEWP